MSSALRRMTNYLGLTEDDGTTQETVVAKPKVAPVKRPTPTLSVAPQLPIATPSQVQEAAPIDRIVTITPRLLAALRSTMSYPVERQAMCLSFGKYFSCAVPILLAT